MVETPAPEDKAPPCVLVVEDEGLIRMMVAETLADSGYRVLEAGNAKEALAVIDSANDNLRAVILDVGLPDANGEALIEKIRALKAGLPIVMTTGYDTNELRQRAVLDPSLRILTKPYPPEQLETILKEWGI